FPAVFTPLRQTASLNPAWQNYVTSTPRKRPRPEALAERFILVVTSFGRGESKATVRVELRHSTVRPRPNMPNCFAIGMTCSMTLTPQLFTTLNPRQKRILVQLHR